MTQYITSFPLRKRDREAIIRKLMRDRPFYSPIQRAGEKALKILDSMPEYVPTAIPLARLTGTRSGALG